MKTKVKDNQSTLDLSIQTAGTIESVFYLALANDLSITDTLYAGQTLTVPPVADKNIYEYYRIKGLIPATASSVTQDEGIEFWAIERDFLVS
jgi:hypothetical protein